MSTTSTAEQIQKSQAEADQHNFAANSHERRHKELASNGASQEEIDFHKSQEQMFRNQAREASREISKLRAAE
jgi:hypothetical protein